MVVVYSMAAEVVAARACPLEGGRFPLRISATAGCQTYLRSGCNGTSIIDVIDTCSTKPGTISMYIS